MLIMKKKNAVLYLKDIIYDMIITLTLKIYYYIIIIIKVKFDCII